MEAQLAEATSQRLPHIRTPTPTTGRPSSRDALTPHKVLSLSRESTRMVMGKLTDNEEAGQGFVVQGGGRHSKPEDFVRLAHGLYAFREEHLLEIWAENGETFARDHGAATGLENIKPGMFDAPQLRRRFCLSESPPYGRGIPLLSFLCRN